MNRLGRPVRVFSAALLAISFAACGSSSSTPGAAPVSDPNEIITRSANGMAAVQTVHFDVTITGSINTAGLGSTGSALGQTTIKLDGATASGDIDVKKQALHLSASLPTLMGLSADIIQVDGWQYMKVSLLGDKYSKSKATDTSSVIASAAPGATLDLSGTVSKLKSQLDTAGAKATLVGHDSVDGRDAYHVNVSVPVSYVNSQLGGLGSSANGMSLDTATVDYWVYSDSLNPAKAQISASSKTLGTIGVTITFTKYNQPVSIAAPPDSQIQAGS